MCEGVMNLFKGSNDPAKQSDNAQKVILASSVLKGVGEVSQGVQARKFYRFQADQAMADAEAERQLGQVRGDKLRRAGRIVQSEAQAAYGASGVRADSVSAQAVGEAIGKASSEDALTELYTGVRRGRVKESEAAGYRRQADNALSAGISSAGRSLLTGAATASEAGERTSKWIKKYRDTTNYGNIEET